MSTARPSFLRHSGSITPQDLTACVNIIGCGAVGSTVAMLAARMGWHNFALWDFDLVEDYNLPNQAFYPKHIGQQKVLALKDLLMEFNPDIKVQAYNKPFESASDKSSLAGHLIIATDSMKTRADITKAFMFNTELVSVLEARLGFDYAEAHVIDPLDFDSISAWKRTLKNDEDIPDGPCNLRICPTLVGIVSNTLVDYLCRPYALQRTGVSDSKPLPFMTRFMLKNELVVRTYPLKKTEQSSSN